MVQSRACVQNVACRRLQLVLPFGLIDYSSRSDGSQRDITGSALWCMHATLGHLDRVQGIWFEGWVVNSFEKFMSVTNYHFPALESLVLFSSHLTANGLSQPHFSGDHINQISFFDVLDCPTVPSHPFMDFCCPQRLSQTSRWTFLPKPRVTTLSQELVLLASLKGMQRLRSLDLTTLHLPYSDHPHPKDIALLKLTPFHFSGPTRVLNKLMPELRAPSFKNARFKLCDTSPLLYISQVIDNVREEFRSVSVNFSMNYFRLLSSTHSGTIDYFKPSFSFDVNYFPHSINNAIDRTPSTKLASKFYQFVADI